MLTGVLAIVASVVVAGDARSDFSMKCTNWTRENAAILSGGDNLPKEWASLRDNRLETARASGWAYCECIDRIDDARVFAWNKILLLKYALVELRFDSVLW